MLFKKSRLKKFVKVVSVDIRSDVRRSLIKRKILSTSADSFYLPPCIPSWRKMTCNCIKLQASAFHAPTYILVSIY